MPSQYLQGADTATYGIPSATAEQIIQASALIDAWCNRSRYGLTYVLGADGNPAYMAGATPATVLTSAAPIAPGSNVTVNVTGAQLYAEMIGKTVTIDRKTPSSTEVCVISGVGDGTVTLGQVNYSHTAPVSLEMDLQVFEERYLPQDRSLARVAHWPVARIVSGLGRYSYGRRSQQVQGNFSEFNLLAILQNFGGPPAWVQFDVNQLGLNPQTGELWIPAGVLLAYYSDVRLWYVAGWTQANLPGQVKQACANIIRNYQNLGPAASSLVKRFQAGDTAIERFADQSIDDETKRLLLPFRTSLLY